jgi:hypothetical protein
MIADCHTHINSSGSDNATATHAETYQDIDICFVLSASSDENKAVAEYAAGKPGKMYAFAAFNPTTEKVTQKAVASAISNAGFCGAILYCATDGFHPAHSRAMRFYEAAEKLNIPVFFHNSASEPTAVLDYAQPYLLDEVARKFPSLKIIIGSMGQPFLRQTIAMVAKHPNVYADLTLSPEKIWEVYNVVVSANEASVMDKLIFGSGFPNAKPGECIETLLGFNRLLADTNLPTVPREKIRTIIERDIIETLGITSR